jgi:hypothetical protein
MPISVFGICELYSRVETIDTRPPALLGHGHVARRPGDDAVHADLLGLTGALAVEVTGRVSQ